MNTCRLCGKSEWTHNSTMIKYGVRHYAHPDCALRKWGAAFFDRILPWQARNFPYLIAVDFGVEKALKARAAPIGHRAHGERTEHSGGVSYAYRSG